MEKTISEAEDKLLLSKAECENLDRDIAKLEAEEEDNNNRRMTLRAELEKLKAGSDEARDRISDIKAEIAVLRNDISHAEEAIAETEKQIEDGKSGKARLEEDKKNLENEIEEKQALIGRLKADSERLTEELTGIDAEGETLSGEYKELDEKQGRLYLKRTQLQLSVQQIEATSEQLSKRKEELTRTAENAAAEAKKQRIKLSDTDAELEQAKEEKAEAENKLTGYKKLFANKNDKLKTAGQTLETLRKEYETKASRHQVLDEIDKNMAGFQPSVKSVIMADRQGRLSGIRGTVADIISVDKRYTVAIEIALGGIMQNIVTDNEEAAKRSMRYLKENNLGRATFLPLTSVKGRMLEVGGLSNENGFEGMACDLVEYDGLYDGIVKSILGKTAVVEDIDTASFIAKKYGYRFKIVTLDGQVINAGGSFTGGSTARSVGVFSRKQELDELRAKVLKLDERRAAAEKEATARKAEVDNLTAQLAGAESEGMTAAAARLKAEMELDQLNTALEEGKNAAAHRGQEIAALEQQLRENTAAAAQAENARKQAEAEIETHRKELESLGASTSDVTRQREEASQKLSDNRMQKLRTEKDLSLHEAALETLKGRSGEAEARVRELQANVAAAKERIAANELRANEIKRAREENKQKITAAEETIRKANAERMEKEAAVTRLTQENRTLTDERERMSGEMARLAERKTAAETELNTTASKLWEEYQLTEAEAEKLCVPFANVADLRRQVAEVRGKIRVLGNVNVGAIEEYKEVKERYDFMKAQVTDVEKSRAELNRMIAELCSEMQEMFTASFKEINRNFGAIFRELFGGGSARLYLSDENDVLNSGIEIQVSPPGKVIKNLSALSGGEQALVAISIYFAILAVNPSPFCILDEIEAALDDVNVTRYAQYLRRMTERTQFIVITHRRGTMEAADVLYGVTMQEDGVSKILRLDLENVSADLIS